MQTSGKRSITSCLVAHRTTKVAGLGLAASLMIVAAVAGVACSPGSLPDDFGAAGGSGGAGGTGAAGTGGMGGAGGGVSTPAPAACANLMISTVKDVETKFVAPRCGIGNMTCHAAIFEPKGLDKPDMVQMLLVNQPAKTLCKTDTYITKGNSMKSYVLAKITAASDKVTCPSGGDGGAKMPFAPSTPLSNDERDCFIWYINQMAAQ